MRKKKKKSIEELLEEALVSKEEQPYQVPKNWVWVRLESISNKITDGAHKTPVYTEKGVPFISVKDIDNGKISFENTKFISEDTHLELIKRCHPQKGDILVTKSGTIGRTAVVDTDIPFSLFVSVALIKPIQSIINSKFLSYYLNYAINQIVGKKYIKGSSIQNLHLTEIKKIEVPLPPVDEQNQIVKKLDHLFVKIDKVKQFIDEVKESFELRRAAILDKAIKGKLVEQDTREESATSLLAKVEIEREKLIKEKKLKKKNIEPIKPEEIPYDIPRNWAWVRLEQITDLSDNAIRRGPFGSAITKEMFVPKGENTYKVYEQKNAIQQNAFLGDYYISEEKYNSLVSFRVLPGDIIVSCAGTIGKTFIIPDDAPAGIINQALLKIRLNNSVIDNEYFLYLFEALLLKHIHQTAKGSAIKNMVSVDYLKKTLLIPLPPIMEQKRIVEKLNFILDNIKKEQEYIESLESELEILKQSILNKAFRGKLGTNDPTEESVIELLKEVLQSK